MPLKIDTTHTQNAEWYGESESSSSSDSSESDEDNEHEGDIAPPHWRQQKLYRSTNPLPISSHIAPPKSRKPRSPFSPLRNSFTAPADEEHASLPSDSSLPEDKKGLDKERADDLLRASRERRAKLMAGMRIRTSPISPPATRVISFNSGAISARRAMDLRKEITLKVHAAKHGATLFPLTLGTRVLTKRSTHPNPIYPRAGDHPAVSRKSNPGCIAPRDALHFQISIHVGTDTRGTAPDVSRAFACFSIFVADHAYDSRHPARITGGVPLHTALTWTDVSTCAL